MPSTRHLPRAARLSALCDLADIYAQIHMCGFWYHHLTNDVLAAARLSAHHRCIRRLQRLASAHADLSVAA